MIKVKILNPQKDRNEPTFRPLTFIRDMLYSDYSIELTTDDDYDYMFVGMSDFMNKKKSLKDSTEWGLQNLEKVTEGGDYFLFEGSDSTSLMGGYEVFDKSKAIYLFKNQTLNSRKDYKVPYAHNKWFWGSGSDLDLSYNITPKKWERIKLTGWNVGWLVPSYRQMYAINTEKSMDLCAIFKESVPINRDHKSRNDKFYTSHRKGLWNKLQSFGDKYEMLTTRMPFDKYVRNLWYSKISFSPFGMGEICFRDFECMQFGTIMIKPNQDIVRTKPDIYEAGKTYIDVKYDWSDLEEKIDYVLDNFDELNQTMNGEIRRRFIDGYEPEKLCLHWYDIFSGIKNKGK
tara:strand:- start:1651 stop:2682 length:1032 start_codon:yes stop_codon:yes gene_type:complete